MDIAEIQKILISHLKENKTETLNETQQWLSTTHNVFLLEFALHDLIFDSDHAKSVRKEIEALNLRCPICKSEEKFYPLFLDMNVICLICGFEYPPKKQGE